MTDYFLVVHHPNGGYAIVECTEGEPAPSATKKNRKFQHPDEAYTWAQGWASKYGVKYSPEVRAENRATFINATRRDR